MGLFDLAEVRLAALEARMVALEGASALNVLDYGAVGDGVTNDTAAIQAAINSAHGAGKGVYFPPGTYYTGPLTVYSDLKMYGAVTAGNPRPTAWTSKLKLVAGAASTMFSIGGAKSALAFKYLDIDGNAANQTANRNIFYISGGSHDITIQGCYIHDCGRDTEGGLGVAGDNSSYVYVLDCTFYKTANDVEPMSGCHHWTMSNCYSSDSVAEAFVGYLSDYNTIVNNTIVHAGSYGVSVNNGDGSLIQYNTFTNCKCAVEIRGDGGGALGNVVDHNTVVAGVYSTLAGIQVWGANARNNEVTNNDVSDWTDDNGPIAVYSAGAGNVVTGNTIDGSAPVLLSSGCDFSSNTVTNGTTHGVRVSGGSGHNIDANEVSGCTNRGFYVSIGATGTYHGNNSHNNGEADAWDGLTAD